MCTAKRIIWIMPLPNVHTLHEVILATARRQVSTFPQAAGLSAHDGGRALDELVQAIAANVAMVALYRCEVALEGSEGGEIWSAANLRAGDLARHEDEGIVRVADMPRAVAGGFAVDVERIHDNPAMRLADGSIHPAHRAGFRWTTPATSLGRP